MSLGTLAESRVYSSLWELKDEIEIGHIQLSRAADFILVCPATADLSPRWPPASPTTSQPPCCSRPTSPSSSHPAMNARMWQHAATQRNVQQLLADGLKVIDPAEGEMACGDIGPGRLPEPDAIVEWLSSNALLANT